MHVVPEIHLQNIWVKFVYEGHQVKVKVTELEGCNLNAFVDLHRHYQHGP